MVRLNLLTRRSRHSSPRFSLCPASPEHPMCSGDGLGAPDTVLGQAEQKEALGHAAANVFSSGATQIPFGDALGEAAGESLNVV
jgi:hypothetical protein